MYVAVTKPLFAWDCLQDSPSLGTIRQFLRSIPDAKLLEGLRQHRGRGRNDCPVHVAWGVVLLRIALRHVSVEATLAELGRNEALRRLIGIETEEGVPKSWNISRFLDTLGQEPHRSELRRIFDAMVQRLGAAVPDLGHDTAGDSTALHARRKGEKAAKAEIAEGLPQPSGGKKEYLDDEGNVTKIIEWFGYKLHLLVDAKHEVVLAYEVTTANAADCKSLPDLIEQGQANLPDDRIETLAYDKAADDNESHRVLNKVCNAGKSYGKTVRVDRTIDLRRFPPIPRATKKFERLYNGRTSVERVNARLKIFWGVDDGNIVGARRFHAMVGSVMIVHVAFATLLASAPRREGTLGKLRLGPIQKALSQQPAA